MIRFVEELAMNALPALQTMLYEGWVLRFANGYTKRANSINPVYASGANVETQIQFCEEMYRARNQEVVFKLTASVQPENLDAVLAQREYRADSPTSVQLLDLGAWRESVTPTAIWTETLTDAWLAEFCRLNAVSERNQATLRQMLGQSIPRQCFALVRAEERVVACGLGVLQDHHIGLFDIVTAVEYRQRGYGTRVVGDLLTWGKRHGAQTAYLQVMLNNAPALRLYAKLGFTERYQYWYRIKR